MGVLNYSFPKCDFSHVFADILLFSIFLPGKVSIAIWIPIPTAPALTGMTTARLVEMVIPGHVNSTKYPGNSRVSCSFQDISI